LKLSTEITQEDLYEYPIDLKPVPTDAALADRINAAVDVLKAAIADDYAMISIENKYGRGRKDDRRKGMAELALDILTGEQELR
jgi:hypothetical protein